MQSWKRDFINKSRAVWSDTATFKGRGQVGGFVPRALENNNLFAYFSSNSCFIWLLFLLILCGPSFILHCVNHATSNKCHIYGITAAYAKSLPMQTNTFLLKATKPLCQASSKIFVGLWNKSPINTTYWVPPHDLLQFTKIKHAFF